MPADATGKPFAINRTVKLKTWSAVQKSTGHTARLSADDRQHINPNPPEPNITLVGSPEWVDEWKNEVAAMWLPKLKQGTTHTLAREFILTASPEWFEGKSKKERDEWAMANVDWARERFGADRVKYAVLHLDEQTPHLAIYVTTLKADTNRKGELRTDRGNGWTLSDNALGLGGHKDELGVLQDEYAEAMKGFELRRGIKGSKAKHQTIAQWRKQMAKPLDKPIKLPKPIEPTMADRINIEDYGKRVAKAAADDIFRQMKPYHQQAKAQAKELAEIKTKLSMLEPLAEAFKRLMELLMGRAPDLHSLKGQSEALTALNAFALAIKGKEPEPQAEPGPVAPERAKRAKPARPRRDGPKRLSL